MDNAVNIRPPLTTHWTWNVRRWWIGIVAPRGASSHSVSNNLGGLLRVRPLPGPAWQITEQSRKTLCAKPVRHRLSHGILTARPREGIVVKLPLADRAAGRILCSYVHLHLSVIRFDTCLS